MRGGSTNVINTILTGMYRNGTYTSIEMLMFRIGLNIDRIGHIGQFWAIPTGTKKKVFFFVFLVL